MRACPAAVQRPTRATSLHTNIPPSITPVYFFAGLILFSLLTRNIRAPRFYPYFSVRVFLIRFIQAHGYSIFENGSRNGWYATSPTMQLAEDEFGNEHYLSVFPTLDQLVKELLEELGDSVV
jgi:hypothetical protein